MSDDTTTDRHIEVNLPLDADELSVLAETMADPAARTVPIKTARRLMATIMSLEKELGQKAIEEAEETLGPQE